MKARLAALVACAALLAGCGQSATTIATSTADPGPAPLDTLFLALDEVRPIIQIGLSPEDPPEWSETPGADTPIASASMIRFKSVRLSGYSNTFVKQSIAEYHNPNDAQSAFNEAVAKVKAASDKVESESPTSVVVTSVYSTPGRGSRTLASTTRVTKNYLIEVQAIPVESPDGVVKTADLISNKVNNIA